MRFLPPPDLEFRHALLREARRCRPVPVCRWRTCMLIEGAKLGAVSSKALQTISPPRSLRPWSHSRHQRLFSPQNENQIEAPRRKDYEGDLTRIRLANLWQASPRTLQTGSPPRNSWPWSLSRHQPLPSPRNQNQIKAPRRKDYESHFPRLRLADIAGVGPSARE